MVERRGTRRAVSGCTGTPVRGSGARAAALALAVAALAGCASRAPAPDASPVADAQASVTESERRVAADLVGVLSRVDAVAPRRVDGVRVTIQRDEPEFARALEAALREAGYDVAASGGPGTSEASLVAGYAVQRGARADEPVATYTVALADVQARRAWSLPAGEDPDTGWAPAGPLFVRGADPGALGPLAPPSGPTAADGTPGAVPTPTRTRAAIPIPPSSDPAPASAPERIAIDPATGSPVYGGVTRGALGGPALPTERNVMDLGGSNFASLFVDYADVVERILVFPNDSERLGPDNKSIVAELAERFDPGSDVFSIVGCSLGPTSLPNGNERLALGRANRVKEELVQVGVPSERIVDEGCWAGDSSERFPSRGVVLTLRRRS